MLGGLVVQNYSICLNKCVNKCFRSQKFTWPVSFQTIWINTYAHEIILFIISDEKEKFEPTVFRDTLVQGLNEAGDDLEAVAKFLDSTGSRLDYRRYADTLFDILVAGSMLGKPYGLAFSYSVHEFQFYCHISS